MYFYYFMNQRCSVKYPEKFAYLDRDNFEMKRPILKKFHVLCLKRYYL